MRGRNPANLERKFVNRPQITKSRKAKLYIKKNKRRSLNVPEILSFSMNHKGVADFLDEFHKLIFERQRYTILDFRTIQYVSAGAALVLVAELDRWRRLYNFKPSAMYVEQWNPIVLLLLEQMGFFEILEVKNPPKIDKSEFETDTKFIRFYSDTLVIGESAKSMKEVVSEVANYKVKDRKLYEAIVEAMQNVIHHAYLPTDNSAKKFEKRWWMTGSFNKSTRVLKIIFYDLGVGIPATLPAKHGIELIQSFLNGLGLINNDANLIYAAMELGRSGTGLAYRGKGLPQMRSLVDALAPGTLRIVSGRGELIYENLGDDAKPTYRRKTHDIGIEGTLIQWQMSLPHEDG
jgi:anti-anti-sigma regulatory factor/anti-sigma regulatory factor (Ser/Thr protein kinase)